MKLHYLALLCLLLVGCLASDEASVEAEPGLFPVEDEPGLWQKFAGPDAASARTVVPGVDLRAVFNSLISDVNVVKTVSVLSLQLVFITIGHVITSALWTIYRGGAITTALNLGGALDLTLTSGNFAADIIAKGFGGAFLTWFIWGTVLLIGRTVSGQGLKRKRRSYAESSATPYSYSPYSTDSLGAVPEGVWNGDQWVEEGAGAKVQKRTDTDFTYDQLIQWYDEQFSFAGSTTQFFINLMGTLGGVVFMMFMSLLSPI